MRIFIFEFVSGGGWWKVDPIGRPAKSLLREGKAMLQAVASDFAALEGCEVVYLQDRRVKNKVQAQGAEMVEIETPVQLFRTFANVAPKCDFGLIIAPEFNNHLHDWATKWLLLGGKLLGPPPEFIRIASSKVATAERLDAAGVPVPRGMKLGWPEDIPADFSLPAVLKPDDGAGSQGILFVEKAEDGDMIKRLNSPEWRLEQYCPGMPASMAILAGPNGHIPLPGSLQWLSDDRKFQYRGGMTPLSTPLNARAQRLALAAARAMPAALGYFGVDLVLGDAADGSQDVVIEINPRLTTSYVGLRAIAKQNLAQAMLDVAAGRSCDLSFEDRRVQFTPDGEVVELS
jgi:predicted ATP-grasp superfamily ATP-dependent carboligase